MGKPLINFFLQGSRVKWRQPPWGVVEAVLLTEEQVRHLPVEAGEVLSAGCYGLTTGTSDNEFNQLSQSLPKPATERRVSTTWEGEETG